jgi:hypothetical protein
MFIESMTIRHLADVWTRFAFHTASETALSACESEWRMSFGMEGRMSEDDDI